MTGLNQCQRGDIMSDYNDGEWHGWNGEDMKPAGIHSKSVIEYVWHNAISNRAGKSERVAGYDEKDVGPAWGDILKFRVVKEHKGPREFWVDPDRCIAVQSYHAGFIHVREVTE